MHGPYCHLRRNATRVAHAGVLGCALLAAVGTAAGQHPYARPSPLQAPAQPVQLAPPTNTVPAPPPSPAPPPPPPVIRAKLPDFPAFEASVTDDPKALEEKYLLPLLAQEQALLQDYGADHPDVRAVRARIDLTRDWIARQPKPPAPLPTPAPAAVQPAVHIELAPPPAPLAAPVVEKAQDMPAAVAPQSPPTPVPPSPAPAAVAPATAPAPDTTINVLVHLVSILAALVVILLVQLVALVVILRRFASRLTPQVRVEVVSASAPPVPGEVVAQRVYLDSPRPRVESPLPDTLGPNYTDELAAQEDAARTAEASVFKQLFEDNARLRTQLDAPEAIA